MLGLDPLLADCDLTRKHISNMSGRSHESAGAVSQDRPQLCIDRIAMFHSFVDANAFMEQLSTQGLLSDGFELNSSLVKGGVFSLDGVHLTARGYALVSKYILEAIDVTYESNFKAAGEMPDIGDYPAFYPETLK